MAETKHTPGPWTQYNDSRDGKTMRREIVAVGKTICRIYTSVPVEDEANARLIAAAPDLLAALRALVECSPCQNGCAPDDMRCATNQARAAIAKAEGRA